MTKELLEQLKEYANEDLDGAVEVGHTCIYQTKLGNLDIEYSDGTFTISHFVSPSAVFSQVYNREQAVDFVVNAYDVVYEDE